MSAISPIGDEIADRAVFSTRDGSAAEICQRIVMTTDQRHPGRRPRTHVKRNSRSGEGRGLALEWMVGFVTPVQSNQIFRQFLDQFRIMQNDVAPEHHSAAASRDFPVNALQKIEVDAAFADFLTQTFALTA